jgi:hypothetical protein
MPTLLEKAVFRCDRFLKGAVGRARDRCYRRPFIGFGPLEAVLFARQIDFWCRASSVLRLLRDALPRGGRVLDTGSGAQGLEGIRRLAGLPDSYRIVPADLRPTGLRGGVAADAGRLPFRDRSFEVAVAMDMLEHVPASARGRVLGELRRVARRRVIVTLPLRSRCGRFDGEAADREFQAWHVRTHGYPEGNTAEHLAGCYPVLEELLDTGPDRIEALCGNEAWLRYMKLSHAPVRWLAAGLAYWLWLKPRDRVPPFHSCLLTWDAP